MNALVLYIAALSSIIINYTNLSSTVKVGYLVAHLDRGPHLNSG